MKLTITNLVNAEKFTHIFQHLKNFTDNIFKLIKWYCKEPREKWISKEITTNRSFKEIASEP